MDWNSACIICSTNYYTLTTLMFQDMAQLLVERSTVMNFIMPSESCQFDGAARTLTAMLEIFTTYLKQARMPSNESYSWVCSKK